MLKQHVRALLWGAAFVLLVGTISAPAETFATPVIVAQATASPAPAPQPTATLAPITYGGFIRSYYFTRQNASGYTKPFAAFNQAAWNSAVSLHAQYNFSNWSVGGTYLYANPFNNCINPAQHVDPLSPCYRGRTFTGPTGGTNPDDTLPDFELSTLYEAYLQYKDSSLYAKIGNQVITTPWANPSDSRLKPVAFQGADISYNLTKNWAIEGMYMTRFEDRASSSFTNTTLLTETSLPSANYGGAGSNILPKPFTSISNNGFFYGRVGYTDAPYTANLHYYVFENIAGTFWGDFKYAPKAYGNPFIALQGGAQTNTGSAIIGKINSQVVGVQGGYSPWKNVDLTVGFNYIPEKVDQIILPAGTTCGANHAIKGLLPYFLPTSGTTNCFTNPNGVTNVYYGGWASPYTDSYATDPLFTTMISQGMADRRSPGEGIKVAATFYAYQKRIRFIAARAWWSYGNVISGVAPTQETNLDATYFFNPVGKGTYHGFSIRERYAERTQAYTTFSGGTPLFKYNRTQLEYDF